MHQSSSPSFVPSSPAAWEMPAKAGNIPSTLSSIITLYEEFEVLEDKYCNLFARYCHISDEVQNDKAEQLRTVGIRSNDDLDLLRKTIIKISLVAMVAKAEQRGREKDHSDPLAYTISIVHNIKTFLEVNQSKLEDLLVKIDIKFKILTLAQILNELNEVQRSPHLADIEQKLHRVVANLIGHIALDKLQAIAQQVFLIINSDASTH